MKYKNLTKKEFTKHKINPFKVSLKNKPKRAWLIGERNKDFSLKKLLEKRERSHKKRC